MVWNVKLHMKSVCEVFGDNTLDARTLLLGGLSGSQPGDALVRGEARLDRRSAMPS